VRAPEVPCEHAREIQKGDRAMKEQFHPVRDNAECERIIQDTYQGVLAMTVGEEPYAVPLNHAYREGRFYFHSASSGRKLDAIRQNPSVAYVIQKYYGDSAELARSMKCHGHWESVIAYGRARVVSQKRELIRTFRIYMAYYGHEDYQHGEELLTKTNVIVIDVDRMSARRESDDFKTDYWTWEREA
jgi:nitroimidazol reductase NimA-like FMN-containing flavoprotein (pyridoxamine 5'-phosphate oxidase superfamily)